MMLIIARRDIIAASSKYEDAQIDTFEAMYQWPR